MASELIEVAAVTAANMAICMYAFGGSYGPIQVVPAAIGVVLLPMVYPEASPILTGAAIGAMYLGFYKSDIKEGAAIAIADAAILTYLA
jgi:hypothetical protein